MFTSKRTLLFLKVFTVASRHEHPGWHIACCLQTCFGSVCHDRSQCGLVVIGLIILGKEWLTRN